MNPLSWFKPATKPIWRTDREEYLRTDKSFADEPEIGFEYFDVYAVYQTDILTGKTRVTERTKFRWDV